MYERKNNTGAIFTNEVREADSKYGTKSKYYTGNALIDGRSYMVRAYITTSKAGVEYLKLTFKEDEKT